MPILLDQLSELGFALATSTHVAPDTLRQELALREFQTYARLTVAAQEDPTAPGFYAARLKSVDLPDAHRFKGDVTGQATGATTDLIQVWQTAKYRCPVVVELWSSKIATRSGRRWRLRQGATPVDPVKKTENIWLWDDPKLDGAGAPPGSRLYVRDFTKRYDHDAEYQRLLQLDGGGRILLGDPYLTRTPPFDGPRSDVPSAGVDVEITPKRLIGKDFADPATTAAEKTTYRVLRAVSQAECQGFFDTINAFDGALVSVGLCHWTLAHLHKGALSKGELEAFFAYLRSLGGDALDAIVGTSGVEPLDAWHTPAIQNKDQRKYGSQLSQLVPDGVTSKRTAVPAEAARLDFFRSWHWFYRFQIALRLHTGLQRAMWDMGRIRIRDILAAPVGLGVTKDTTTPALLGDVFRSEQTVTLLCEWHVLSPGTLFKRGKPATKLVGAIKDSKVDLTKPTNTWTDKDEERLRDALKNSGGKDIRTRFEIASACRALHDCPHPTGGTHLSIGRGSFDLDMTGLPASPFGS